MCCTPTHTVHTLWTAGLATPGSTRWAYRQGGAWHSTVLGRLTRAAVPGTARSPGRRQFAALLPAS